MHGRRLTILLSGMIASDPHQGGATWAVLQYLLGFRRLGHDVYFVEPLQESARRPAGVSLEQSANAVYFRQVAEAFGLVERAALLQAGTRSTANLSYDILREVAARADVLINISGMLTDETLTDPIPIRVYLDLDPAFNQLWHAVQGIDMRFAGHTHFVTVGQAIGHPECPVPTCGRRWQPTVPPIVLDDWPCGGPIIHEGLTTIANWRGYGSIEYHGEQYGQKAHSFRRFITLPKRTRARLMPALAIHPDEVNDLTALANNGWQLLDPAHVANTPEAYRNFVRGSRAELGIAKSGYVVSRCGWFSDRSVCYLASGRPVIGQDTGFSRFLPTGAGLFAFETMESIEAALESLNADYEGHSRKSRELAEEVFDSDKVLNRLLRNVEALS